MNVLPEEDGLFYLKEVSEALRVSVKTVRRMIADRQLRYVKVRGQIFIRRGDLQAFLRGQLPVAAR
jgi:excisionase family DNA binding protein